MFQMKTPVLLMLFNRPEMALQVFEKIRQIRPPKFFIICDGARPNREGEAEKVQQCREIKDKVDWECEIFTNFSNVNMGCKDRVASGITWAFEQVEELIILEDDCVPDLSFFRFCQELLEKYRYDNRIMSISGYNGDTCEFFDESYAFCKLFECWGWATWKRAWDLFDIDMKHWSKLKQNSGYFKNIMRKYNRYDLINEFQAAYEDKIDSWAYRFYVCSIINHGLNIIPKVNMVRNIGFGKNGTHTSNATKDHLYMDEEMYFPLDHPDIISPLDRLFIPPNINTNEDKFTKLAKQEEMEQILKENNYKFNRLLKFKQYYAIVILFKSILRRRDTFLGPNANLLALYHYQYVYYVAVAYFNLGDYEHAVAMLNIVLSFDPNNIDILIFLANILIKKQDFEKARNIVDVINNIKVTDDKRNEIENIIKILENV